MNNTRHTFTPSDSRLGSELSPEDRSHVLAAFVHRMTVEARRQWPDFARRMIAGGYRMPLKTDAQWLAETRFATDSLGRLDRRVSNCEQEHEAAMRDLETVRQQDAAKAQAAQAEADERAHWEARDTVTV